MPETEPDIIYGGCNCCNCNLTILPNGDVYACCRLPSRVGNAFEDDLTHIWLEDMEAYQDYTAFEKCTLCKLLPYCRGYHVAYAPRASFMARTLSAGRRWEARSCNINLTDRIQGVGSRQA